MSFAKACWIAMLTVGTALGDSSAATPSDWSVEDSIAVRYFKPQTGDGTEADWASNQATVFSPDGRYFFAVTSFGDLAQDTVVNELYVFSTTEVRRALRKPAHAPTPLRRLRVASTYADDVYAPIMAARWEGSDSIVFTGTRQQLDCGVYRYTVSKNVLQRLSSPDHITGAQLTEVGLTPQSIIYVAQDKTAAAPERSQLEQYPFAPVTGSGLKQLHFAVGAWMRARLLVSRLFVATGGQAPRPAAQLQAGSGMFGPWVSPNGKFAIMALATQEFPAPKSWSGYERQPPKHWYRFMLIDLQRATAAPVFDAPLGASGTRLGNQSSLTAQALWSQDSSQVTLINTALPLSANEPERQRMAYVVNYSVSDGRWSIVEPLPAREARVKSISPAGNPQRSAEINVVLQQGASQPPALIAMDGHRQVSLLGPDPALANKWLAAVRPVHWREKDGHVITGGLMLPRHRQANKPVPLVIQIYYYLPNYFRPDGPFSSAYAAQALVAQGIAVLAMDMPQAAYAAAAAKPDIQHWRAAETDTALEYRIFMENLDAAVESLAAAGWIDPRRVGLVGFSRGGYLAHYAVTHPRRTQIAAAIAADSITGSYGEYVAEIAFADTAEEVNRIARRTDFQFGGPFWQQKQRWLEAAPLFNVDRSKTPMLFNLTDIGEWIYALETLAAWKVNRRPFDCLMFPETGHEFHRPKERYEVMRATVDWMNFWLQDVAPADPQRRSRWEQIAAQWRATSQ